MYDLSTDTWTILAAFFVKKRNASIDAAMAVAMQSSRTGGWRAAGQNGMATASSVLSVRSGRPVPFASLMFLLSPKCFSYRNSANSKHSPICPVD